MQNDHIMSSQKNGKKMSAEAIIDRRDEIKKIMVELADNGIPVNRNTVHAKLRDKFDVSAVTVYRDIVAISRENTWVRDLSESTYSEYQEKINDTLDWIHAEARKLYDASWAQERKIARTRPGKDGKPITVYEAVSIEDEFRPKATLLKIIMDVQDLKIRHTNGENINVSAALLGNTFEKAKAKLKKLEEIAAQTTAAAFMNIQENKNNADKSAL